MGTKLHVQASAEKPYRELSPLGEPTPVLGFRASHPEPTQDPLSLTTTTRLHAGLWAPYLHNPCKYSRGSLGNGDHSVRPIKEMLKQINQ